jgi:hypothetical protein
MRPEQAGFVLPLVILVIVLVALATAIMLERSGSTIRRTAVQVGEYQDHHASRGIRTVINAWVRQYNATEMRELLDKTGEALEIRLADGSRVTVYLRDGQGTSLAERGALTDATERDEALVLLDALALTVPDQAQRSAFIRDFGPMRVSIASAPREVLAAVAYLALEDPGLRDQWVNEVLSHRENTGGIDSAAVTQITNRVLSERGETKAGKGCDTWL